MTLQTQTAAKAANPAVAIQYGDVQDIPLNRLKASPRNARRVGHTAEDVESRAASIKAKGLLQPLVVEPEIKDGGARSGYYLVSVGEGRRQALKLLAKRKIIGKAEPVRCVVDTLNDPAEISLDENVSRRSMHPADEYEAFRDLAERKGWNAVEIAARFGVTPETVTRRLRLGAVAPALLDLYREDALTLDHLMAFALCPDQTRQMQVFAQLPAHDRSPRAIRRAMVETKVHAEDRRAVFVGLDAYVEAGGFVLRDLFTEDHGGWLEDVALLDRLVAEKLAGLASDLREDEGWKWSAAYLDQPHGHGYSRIWDHALERSPEAQARIDVLYAERDALTERWGELTDVPEDADARHAEIERELETLCDDYGWTAQEKARAGLFVVLDAYGEPRIERGFVRPEDALKPEPEDEGDGDEEGDDAPPWDETDDEGDEVGAAAEADGQAEPDEPVGDPLAPLPGYLVADLTAHRSAALRDVLACNPDLALVALTHALVLRLFVRTDAAATCLDIRMASHDLASEGEGIEDSLAGRANAERHAAWARQVPAEAEAVWDFVVGLDGDSRASLLAHCVAMSLNAVRNWQRRPLALAHAERLATALDLDMTAYWSPTPERYLAKVTKAHILAAVAEGASTEAAGRLAGLKKDAMVEAAEPVLAGTGWLPPLLRTAARSVAEGAMASSGAAPETPDLASREAETEADEACAVAEVAAAE